MDRRPLERVIENNVNKYAERLGIKVRYKMFCMGDRAWPDRMYGYRGRVLFIEYKREGERATPKQALKHEMLRAEGFDVYVVDNINQGRGILTAWVAGAHAPTRH